MSMQSLLAASQSMIKMQTMQSARTQMQGKANVLRIESKQDNGDKEKDAQAADLEKESSNLMGNLMDEVNNANQILKPEEDDKAENVSKEEEAAKSPKTDAIELSDSATRRMEEGIHGKPATLEAVTYQADGSANPSAQTTVAPTLEITA